ncbi:MAG TPA: BON domain-containing protein [Bryobacteraceae bacterium]|nr:BON domain-containing protein [Bryobacteraceae bacterium]
MKNVLALTAGLGAGAGLMYLFDPKRGRSRRRRVIGEVSSLLHKDEHKLEKPGKDLLNRVRGVVSDAAAILSPAEHVSDEVLAERVRSHMGHVISNPHRIEVHAAKGVIRLEGNLSHSERRRLHKEIEAVAGVRCVHDGLKHRFPITPGILVSLAAGISLFRRTHREAIS